MRAELVLEPCEREGRLEREVDVVTEEQVSRLRLALETSVAVATCGDGLEQLTVVSDIERAAQRGPRSRIVGSLTS